MKQQKVCFIEQSSVHAQVKVDDAYRFNEWAGWVPVQRLCFWLLRKIGAFAYVDTVKTSTHVLDTDKFMENVDRQRRGLLDMYDLYGERLLIGVEEYQDFMSNNAEYIREFSFGTTYNKGQFQICGMEVTVIPWMKGVLVLPKGFQGRRAA